MKKKREKITFFGVDQCFLFCWNFAKFWPEKCDFNLYKEFSMKKIAQICPISNKVFLHIIVRFLRYVPVSSQEYKRIFFFFSFFLLSYLVCCQVLLNHLMDDHHFSYITKLTLVWSDLKT
jgi:hypothetical protein